MGRIGADEFCVEFDNSNMSKTFAEFNTVITYVHWRV